MPEVQVTALGDQASPKKKSGASFGSILLFVFAVNFLILAIGGSLAFGMGYLTPNKLKAMYGVIVEEYKPEPLTDIEMRQLNWEDSQKLAEGFDKLKKDRESFQIEQKKASDELGFTRAELKKMRDALDNEKKLLEEKIASFDSTVKNWQESNESFAFKHAIRTALAMAPVDLVALWDGKEKDSVTGKEVDNFSDEQILKYLLAIDDQDVLGQIMSEFMKKSPIRAKNLYLKMSTFTGPVVKTPENTNQ